MLFVHCSLKLSEVELALRRATLRHEVHLLAVNRMDHAFTTDAAKFNPTVMVFTLCQPQLYAALLSADARLSAFLPCRIAAIGAEEGVELHAANPRSFCQLLNRPDLERLAAPLETLLREVMLDAARPQAATAPSAPATTQQYSIGATEQNVSVRSIVPQRIDCRGTKVEELAGLDKHDSAGG
ncbi:MAG: DUF302 domain-containing protein [Bryobacterales bacterium]|nr:DUF302 domain-containing protein [Bryobacterales bacterium]